MPRIPAVVAAIAVAVASVLVSASLAAAHERRTVGPYQLVVGFLSEPAFAGDTNGVDLTVTDTRAGNKPVEGVEKTLAVEIHAGGLARALPLALRARFGQPGHYAADFIPTRSGGYSFVFKGKIESLDVNETFESGPGKFNDVESTSKVQFPDQVPGGADLSRQLGDLQTGIDQVRLLAGAAVVLGIAAIGVALVRTRRA